MKKIIPKEDRKSLISFGVVALLIFFYAFRFTVSNLTTAICTVLMIFPPVFIIKYCPKMWLKPILSLVCYAPFMIIKHDDIMYAVLILMPILVFTLMADAVGKNYSENYAVLYMSLSTLILVFGIIWSIINQQTISGETKELHWDASYSVGILIVVLMIILLAVGRDLPKNKGNKDSFTKLMFVFAIISCGAALFEGYFAEYTLDCAYYTAMWAMFFAVMDFSEVPQWNLLMEKLKLRK